MNMKMTPYVYVSILVTLIAISQSYAQDSAASFHCARMIGACKNQGICNTTTGECICKPANTGHDCQLIINAPPSTCATPCKNAGVCISTNKCYCTPDYYGNDCSQKRLQVVDCTAENIDISIMPQGDAAFSGNVTIMPVNPADVCGAPVTRDNDSVYRGSYPIKPDAAADCAGALDIKNLTSGGGLSYTYKVLIQYNRDMIFGTDQVIQFTCRDDMTSSLSFNLLRDMDKLTGETQENRYNTVKLSILRSDKTSFSGAVGVGTKLFLAVTINDDVRDRYDKVRVVSCKAFDKAITTGANKMTLISDKCPTTQAASVINAPMDEDASLFRTLVPFVAFKFIDSTVVTIECEVHLCQKNKNDAECIMTDCSGGLTKNLGRRRKRAAGDGDQKVSAQYEVIMYEGAADASKDETDGDSRIISDGRNVACEQNYKMIFIIAAVALVSLIAFIVAVVFIISQHKAKESMSKLKN